MPDGSIIKTTDTVLKDSTFHKKQTQSTLSRHKTYFFDLTSLRFVLIRQVSFTCIVFGFPPAALVQSPLDNVATWLDYHCGGHTINKKNCCFDLAFHQNCVIVISEAWKSTTWLGQRSWITTLNQWLYSKPERPTHSRMHAKEKRCSSPSPPKRCQSGHPENVDVSNQHAYHHYISEILLDWKCSNDVPSNQCQTQHVVWFMPHPTPHLKEHSDDCHHRKAAIGKLCAEFFCLLGRIRWSQDLEAEVSSGSRCARRLILRNLAECHVGQDLAPTCRRHLGDCCKSIWHVSKFESGGWGQIAWELASDPQSVSQPVCLPGLAWTCAQRHTLKHQSRIWSQGGATALKHILDAMLPLAVGD